MTRLMKIALEQLADQPEDTQKLWAARIINGLRGCPNGLEPGAFVPEDWSEGDEIFEALLATTSDDLRRAMEAAEADSGGETMSLESFLDQEAARDGADETAAAGDAELANRTRDAEATDPAPVPAEIPVGAAAGAGAAA